MSKLDTARIYAMQCHRETNHFYAGKHLYEYHLKMVYDQAVYFSYLIPSDDHDLVFAGAWVHDCLEDCRVTYNDLKKVCGEEVAELAYALTNEKGRTREERANEKYYKGIRETKYAVFLKLCDRIANVTYSKYQGGKNNMLEKYKAENDKFEKALLTDRTEIPEKVLRQLLLHHEYCEMFLYLKKLFEP